MKKIIIALLASYAFIGAYTILKTPNKQWDNMDTPVSVVPITQKQKNTYWEPDWESPFKQSNIDKYYTNDVYELPVYEAPKSATRFRSESLFALPELAVPMGEVRVASATSEYNKKRIIKSTSICLMNNMQTYAHTAAIQSTAKEAIYTYRNFVAISSISTSPSFAPKASNGTTTLPPPPNIVVKDNVLPIGNELAILLFFVLFYVIKRRN